LACTPFDAEKAQQLLERKTVGSPEGYSAFLPFDFYWIITPIVRRLHPCQVIICETDLWPNFLFAARHSGASIALRGFLRILLAKEMVSI
jgi:3-deoxy-D-manno-octulosonic-acid transferase